MLVFNVQVVHAPQRIVIGGGLSRSGRIFRDLAVELDRYYVGCAMEEGMQSEIVPSFYLDECNLLGAAHNYFQRYPAAITSDQRSRRVRTRV